MSSADLRKKENLNMPISKLISFNVALGSYLVYDKWEIGFILYYVFDPTLLQTGSGQPSLYSRPNICGRDLVQK